MAKKSKATKRGHPRERREQRFEPRASASRVVIYAIGALGAFAMGAGVWSEFGSLVHEGGPEPLKFAPYVLAVGAVLVGIAIWIGTSGDPPVRVGDAGIAVEHGGVRRMPWNAVHQVSLREGSVHVAGKDDAGADMTIIASIASHPQAAAWIVQEARQRIPVAVDVADDAVLPRAVSGLLLPLEPPQVVGKRCAASGKIIAYEPDGRTCPRCERVYHKLHVPDSCACGMSLAEFRSESTKTA